MDYDENHPEHVSFSNALSGHLMVAVAEAVVVAAVLGVVRLAVPELGGDVATVVVMAAVASLLSAVACAVLERPAVVAARHPSPGGWGYAIWQFVVPAVAGGLVGWIESSSWAVVCAATMWLVNTAEALWVKPWRPALGRQEVGERIARTREMSEDARLRDGWVGPARQQRDAHERRP